ncbi:hypothetical protein [Aliirhizobium cellulosilyticum]|uniref:Phage ABA sandwich domain-containing protein n=1 Tax=Aliirhizobium cellulosilyticum TaxID=393664 RepID=A0A7W6Y4P0_9HYPH|nr:hypothetical protein [Rhizobium cellulosilyticum]MBB4348728.1 hypothetical protein [Rhizobium cellulosilyticum]MBB4411964.1 hypothetical protein [Rhizobium cellulosilyticum]MBB4449436.1 hypothetical protein [Rhizobium cellulosilyticum]
MGVHDTIKALLSTKQGSRDLDLEVAAIFGWSTAKVETPDKASGFLVYKTVWIDPKTSQPGFVPHYTTDLQAGYDLSAELSPQGAVAVVIESDASRATFEGEDPIYHPDPAVALCIACLTYASRHA